MIGAVENTQHHSTERHLAGRNTWKCEVQILYSELWIHCSAWNNCSTSVQRSGCTFHDLL